MAKIIMEKVDDLKKTDGAFLVFPHKSVDGDCVGSSCAVVSLIRNLGGNAWVCMPEELPTNMSFLGVEDLLFYPGEDFLKGDLKVYGKHYVFWIVRQTDEFNVRQAHLHCEWHSTAHRPPDRQKRQVPSGWHRHRHGKIYLYQHQARDT